MFHNFKNKSSASARIMICDGSGDNVCVQLVSEPMMIIAVNNLKSLEVIAEWIETAKTNLINSKIKEGAF